EEQQRADPAVEERLGDAHHLVGDVASRRASVLGDDAGEPLAVDGAAVTRAEAAAGYAEVARERGQAPDRPPARPAVGALVHGAAAEHDHRRSRRRVAAPERGDALRGDPRDARGPRGRVVRDKAPQLVEAERVAGDELTVVQPRSEEQTSEL